MAFILNQYEIEEAELKAAHDVHRPNLQRAVLTLARLVEWTNNNSDGWAYWSKPTTASKKLQQLIHDRYFGAWVTRVETDIKAPDLKAAYAPIKSFLTRQGVEHREIFPND